MKGQIEGRRKGVVEDEMVGWHHQLNGHELKQTLEDIEGQKTLVCYSLQSCKESEMTVMEHNILGT